MTGSRLGQPDLVLRDLTCDSRQAGPETGFFALQGARHDGHQFVGDAVQAGAPAVFVTDPEAFARLEEAPAPPGGTFLVSGGREALADLSAELYGHPSRELRLLGVTGTNGKTTVTHLAAQLLRAMGTPCGIAGTLGMTLGDSPAELGLTTPEAPDIQRFLSRCREGGIGAVAMEASSIGIAMARTRGLSFRGAAFTNLTQDHLDYHGTMERYRDAKFDLFLRHEVARAVVNLDDPTGRELAARLKSSGAPPALGFAAEGVAGGGAELRMEGASWDTAGMRGELCLGERRAPFASPLLGRFNLSNLLAAVGLLTATGAEFEAVAAVAAAGVGAPGRFERIPVPHGFTVVVDYAHTPDALVNALETAREIAAGALWVVFGCGGERDAAKRPRMGAIAERLAERTILTSDNPRGEPPGAILDQIARGLRDPGAAVRIEAREEAIRWTLGRAREGDLVLIAGKGHETYQEIEGRRLPFSDREVVQAWAGETGN